MKSNTVRFLSLVAVAAMGLAACAPLAAAPETQSAESPAETVAPVVETEAPTSEAEIELTGSIERMTPTAMTLNGKVVAILPATELKGTFGVGDLVKAHATLQADGSLAAREIEPVQGAEGSSLSVQGAEYDFTGAVEAIAFDQWTVAATTFAVTPATEIKSTFAIGDLVKVHLLVAADSSLVAREIEAPEAELAKGGEGAEVELVALIQSISPEAWVIGGQTLAITPGTEIKGSFIVGDAVKVHVLIGAGGTLTAREIEAAEVGEFGKPGDDNTNSNSNANSNESESGNANANGNSNDNADDHGNSNGNSGGNSNSNGSGSG